MDCGEAWLWPTESHLTDALMYGVSARRYGKTDAMRQLYMHPDNYRALQRELVESGPGLAAKYPDATPAAKPRQEVITCDVGADWED